MAVQHADDHTMAIPDVEILAGRLFTLRFNVFAIWHQRQWFEM